MATFQTKDRMSWFKRDLEANFEGYFRGLPGAPDLATGERISKVIGKLDMPNTMRPAGRPGIAFVGDAAMAADPLWGVGCGWAFQSAEWLAEELAQALEAAPSNARVDAAVDRYRKRHRRQFLGHFLVTSDYATGRRLTALERMLFARMYADMDAETSRAILRLYRATDDPGAMGKRHADALRPLDRPALVVWGAHDPYIPVTMAARQREAFPSAEIEVLDDSGHWPFADDPEAVGRLIEPFLRRAVGAERAVVTA